MRYAVFREKLPFLLLALASALVTLLVQRAGGALGPLDDVPLGARAENALRSIGLYVAKTFAPTGLGVFHPHPFFASLPGGPWSAPAVLGLLLTSAWLAAGVRWRGTAPWLLVGALWFLGMLVPVLGLVQVGLQGWAERYSYLPSIGLALALVWSLEALARSPGARRVGLVGALAALALLARASDRQAESWRDSRTLFARALAAEESEVAHTNLALALEQEGDLAGAERHHARAAELAPRLAGPRVNHARVLTALGRRAEAEVALRAALAAEPDLALAHGSLGWLLVETQRDAEGLTHLRRAAELAPEPAHRNTLAWVLATSPDQAAPAEALALAETLIAASRGVQPAHLETLAAALARLGRFDEAAQWQARALEHVRGPARAGLEERLALYRSAQPYVRRR